jgi:hypothetical protein
VSIGCEPSYRVAIAGGGTTHLKAASADKADVTVVQSAQQVLVRRSGVLR